MHWNMHEHTSEVVRNLAEVTDKPVNDALGTTIEFLVPPGDGSADLCVIRGVVPPGVTVPIHSHDDAEEFFIIAGSQQVLIQGARGLEWHEAHAGDYVHVQAGTPHAHRNVSGQPAVDLLITNGRLGRFFQEAARPITDPPQPPTPEDAARFAAVAARYGYTLGTLEENAAVGIQMPEFADR